MHVAGLDSSQAIRGVVSRRHASARRFNRFNRGFRSLADDDVDWGGEFAGAFAGEELDQAVFGRAMDDAGAHEVLWGYGGGGVEARGVDPELERVEVYGGYLAGVAVYYTRGLEEGRWVEGE